MLKFGSSAANLNIHRHCLLLDGISGTALKGRRNSSSARWC